MVIDDEPYNIEALKFIFQALNLRGYPESVDFFYDAEKALGKLE